MASPATPTNGDEKMIDQIDVTALAERLAPVFGMLANMRAIPAAADGLAPVRRRVLFTALRAGLVDNNYRKCAAIVGDAMAKYHPHGDSSIYGALVGMAQPWNMRYPLITGQGNFGSPDGAPPAAFRYTEATLSPIGALMLRDLYDEAAGIVDWVANYDGRDKEPLLLPARFPTLLANGHEGVGWGDRSVVLPHNLRELSDAAIALIDDPKLETAKLAKLLPAPDFPMGATIVSNDDWDEIIETGKGKVVVRAKMHTEPATVGRRATTAIVVDELPFKVSGEALIAKIEKAVNDLEAKKSLAGVVADVRTESSSNTRIVIALDPGVDPDRGLNALLLATEASANENAGLQKSYIVDQRVLIDGIPVTLGTRQLLGHWIDHQFDVLTRRTKFFLDRAERQLDLEEAVMVAYSGVEEIIRMAKSAADTTVFRAGILKKFRDKLHKDQARAERQAEIISDLPVRRLVKLDISSTKERIAKLKTEIAEYKRLLATKAAMGEQLKTEIRDIKSKFGDDRRTVIATAGGGAEIKSAEEMIPDEDFWVTLSAAGYVGRMPEKAFRAQKRGGAGINAQAREDDPIVELVHANARDRVWVLTDAGNLFGLRVADVEESGRGSKGSNIRRFLSIGEDENPVKIVIPPTKDAAEGLQLIIATRDGRVERNNVADYNNLTSAGLKAIKLVNGDRIVSAALARSGQQLLAVSTDGHALRFDIDDVSIQGRGAQGVASQKLGVGATVVSLLPVDPDDKRDLAVILSNGKGKRSKLVEYPVKGRGSRGQRTADMAAASKKAPANIVFAAPMADADEVVLITSAGKVVRMEAKEIKRQGRATAGVQVVNLSQSTKAPESVTGGSIIFGAAE